MDKVEIKRIFEECDYVNLVGKIWYHPAAPRITVFYKDGFIVSSEGSKSDLEVGQLEFNEQNLNDLAMVGALS